MSVDVPLDAQLAPARAGGKVTDLIVVYGGWEPGVDPLKSSSIADTGSGPSDLIAQLRGLTLAPFHQIKILPIQGHLPGTLGVQNGMSFITLNFDPRGALIVYGYSAGGTDALTLCRAITRSMARYGLSSRQFQDEASAASLEARRIERSGKTVVDLLITIDAAAGPGSGRIDRHVAKSVKKNLNIYQPNLSPILSRGGANSADDSTFTSIENVSLNDQKHSTIDEATVDRAMDAIRGVLGISTDTPSLPSNLG